MSTKSSGNRYIDLIRGENKEETKSERTSNRYIDLIKNFKKEEPSESFGKSATRTGFQIPLGIAKRYTYPANLAKAATQGASQEILRDLMENDPSIIPEVAKEAQEKALEKFPTQEKAEELIEKYTGIPLTPKNKLQKNVRFASEAASLRPGGLLPKATAAVAAPTLKAGLQKLGVPEGVSEFISLGASGAIPAPSLSKISKASGMPARRFENLTKETKISPSRHEIITETVEKDFKKVAEGLLEKNKTYSAMKEDAGFKDKIGDLFGDVEEIASKIPGKIHTDDVRSAFKKRYNNRESKGISPDEFEKSFRKEIKGINKDIPYGEITPTQLVEQFRKNNKSLKELFEPGKSSAYNRAKREALLEYNRSIEDVISKKYPDSEFKKLFEFTNKRWQEINDIEQIESTFENMFKNKINFNKAREILRKDKDHVSRPFKRILGEEGFKDFKTLTTDLLASEKPYEMLKKAKEAGFKDLAKLGLSYVIHPSIAKSQVAIQLGKNAYQTLLDKPQVTVTWKNALQELKEGKFAKAEENFRKLDKEFNPKGQTSK